MSKKWHKVVHEYINHHLRTDDIDEDTKSVLYRTAFLLRVTCYATVNSPQERDWTSTAYDGMNRRA